MPRWTTTFVRSSFLFVMVTKCAALEPQGIYDVVESGIKQGTIAGAQVVVGEADEAVVARNYGICDVEQRQVVDDETRFCIGSCSKMFAGAVLVSLDGDGVVDLDAPIDRWLPAFAQPPLANDGKADRAPTLRELLCHRSGVYSQRHEMTPSKTRWIRDFTLTLTQSVDGIATEAFASQPGTEFAYSGAGYCVLGRAAEVAANQAFDELLKSHVAHPLGLSRTSYFPPIDDENIASGHAVADGKLQVVELTPHRLRARHRLPLIGGSIYAPAREVAEFARMLLFRGKAGNVTVLSEQEWRAMTTGYERPNGAYGLGLSVMKDPNSGKLLQVSHGGALSGSFSYVAVNFQTNRFATVNYTGTRNRDIDTALLRWVGHN